MWANLWTLDLSSPISWLILQSFGVRNALFGMRSWSWCYWLITKQPPGYHGFVFLCGGYTKTQSQLQCFCLQQVSITIRIVQLECKGCWQSPQFLSLYFQLGEQRGYREQISFICCCPPTLENSPLPKDEYHHVLCLFDHSNLSVHLVKGSNGVRVCRVAWPIEQVTFPLQDLNPIVQPHGFLTSWPEMQ